MRQQGPGHSHFREVNHLRQPEFLKYFSSFQRQSRALAPNTTLVFLASVTAWGIKQTGSNVWKGSTGSPQGSHTSSRLPAGGWSLCNGAAADGRTRCSMGRLPPAPDLFLIPAQPSTRKWPCRGGALEKTKMGVRKRQTPKHTKNAMAKRLLGLVEG